MLSQLRNSGIMTDPYMSFNLSCFGNEMNKSLMALTKNENDSDEKTQLGNKLVATNFVFISGIYFKEQHQ